MLTRKPGSFSKYGKKIQHVNQRLDWCKRGLLQNMRPLAFTTAAMAKLMLAQTSENNRFQTSFLTAGGIKQEVRVRFMSIKNCHKCCTGPITCIHWQRSFTTKYRTISSTTLALLYIHREKNRRDQENTALRKKIHSLCCFILPFNTNYDKSWLITGMNIKHDQDITSTWIIFSRKLMGWSYKTLHPLPLPSPPKKRLTKLDQKQLNWWSHSRIRENFPCMATYLSPVTR